MVKSKTQNNPAKTAFLYVLILSAILVFTAAEFNAPKQREFPIADSTALEELGEALFSDARFSSPDGKLSGLKKDKNTLFSISCKSCHLIDEELKDKGMRGYTDFSKRSRIPFRIGDVNPLQFTHRRTQQLINVSGSSIGASEVHHWDGEFEEQSGRLSLIKLIEKTFFSRNMGWRAGEEERSRALRLKYILEEKLTSAGKTAEEEPSYIDRYCSSFGMSRNEFFKLSGDEILYMCNLAIAFYIENIKSDIESPFDLFLTENGLADPKTADENVLNEFLLERKNFIFLNKTVPILNSEIATLRKVKFGKKELEGLRLFMNKERTNCTGCHTPPSFTNNRFYNIGVSEFDYKDIHGKFPGDFYTAKRIQEKLSSEDQDILKMIYQVFPVKINPAAIDLGRGLFDHSEENFAAFRTPGLRNLKYSNPYLHSGRAKTLKDAVIFHFEAASLREELRFISPKLKTASLSDEEINSLVAFLRSLNDHYE